MNLELEEKKTQMLSFWVSLIYLETYQGRYIIKIGYSFWP